MIVNQAIYGELSGGHALLAFSPASDIQYEALLDRTDLQGASPPGTEWHSYLSGFPFAHSYVLMRTARDTTASRGGMVVSHAIFIPISELGDIADLELLSSQLPTIPVRKAANTILPSVDLTSAIARQSAKEAPLGAGQLASALMSTYRYPVVWVGEDGFEDAVHILWNYMWPELRSSFSFKLAFTPQDAYTARFTAVCTPGSCASRWIDYTVVRREPAPDTILDDSLSLLNSFGDQQLRALAADLGYKPTNLADFNLLRSLSSYVSSERAGLDETLGAFRLLAGIASERSLGQRAKYTIERQLIDQIPSATVAQIRAMRNLDVQPFRSPEEIWKSVALWAAAASEGRGEDTAFIELLTLAAHVPDTPWARAILDGAGSFRKGRDVSHARRLWKWWHTDPALVPVTFQRLRMDESLEDALVASIPNAISPVLAEILLPECASHRLFRLHAKITLLSYDFLPAVQRHIQIDSNPASTRGSDVLVASATPAELVTAALLTHDIRLVTAAGGACSSEPKLLLPSRVHDVTWRQLLECAVRQSPDHLDSFDDMEHIVHDIIQMTVEGVPLEPSMSKAIGSTRWADLRLYPGRGAIWSRIPEPFKTMLITRTAAEWITHFEGSAAEIVEPELQSAIAASPQLAGLLERAARQSFLAGVRLFAAVATLPEWRFESWLVEGMSRNRTLEVSTAKELGRLVGSRRWSGVADRIIADVSRYNRYDLVPAIAEFDHMLKWWQRWRLRDLSQYERAYMNPARQAAPARGDDPVISITSEVRERHSPSSVAVILTALEVEFAAVTAHLTNLSTESHPQGTLYETGSFLQGPQRTWKVAVVQTGPGNTAAAVEAERAISYFSPKIVLFVGVAGGLKDVRLGDVVAATKVYGYEAGKAGAEFYPRPDIGHSSYELVQAARKVARDRRWQQRIIGKRIEVPSAFVAPMAAGEKVVASFNAPLYHLLKNNFSDSLAVEMESAGFLRAGYSNSSVRTVVVRGISDLIDKKAEADSQGSQAVASENAAAFAFELIAVFAQTN